MADRPYGAFPAGRSAVSARRGMVSTSQPLAATAGLDVLRRGGNAFDAAVAAAAVLAVVEPMMTGPGGDVFVLAWRGETGELIGLNASGRSPAAVDASFFRGQEKIPAAGPFSVSVPGAVDGWATLIERCGSWPLDRILAPAIEYADDGFPVSEIIAGDWNAAGPQHAGDPDFNRVYLKNRAEAYRPGEVFRNPDLAATLRAVAEGGRDAFYRGPFARACADRLNAAGWPMTLDDLAAPHAEWVDPISTAYKGVELFELPPNGQGLAALEILNIVEGLDLGDLGRDSPDYWHLLIEAKKLAFADLDAWLADPKQRDLPVSRLISKEYAAEQRERIDPARAAPSYASGIPSDGDTVYLTVVDEQRNCVSFINSLFHGFGSGVVVPGTGVILQNRGSLFSLRDGHPNRLEGGKRPYHTIIPAMAFRGDKPWMTFGVMGGDMQPQGHAQVLLNRIEFGMNVQEAGEAARFRHYAEGVALESGVGRAIARELERRGHTVLGGPSVMGGYQAVEIDWDRGVLLGGSDPRKDGCAVGY